ncbi:hypothetical protein EV363DRAFT_1294400 [Boletus edulis]|nr:hypothetical protein EV363DRAFT_1294400 [Boletus edulis]
MSIGNEPESEVTVGNRQESVGEFNGDGGESRDDWEVFQKWDRSSEVREKVDALDHWGRRIGVSKDMTELERRSSEVTKTRPGVQELHDYCKQSPYPPLTRRTQKTDRESTLEETPSVPGSIKSSEMTDTSPKSGSIRSLRVEWSGVTMMSFLSKGEFNSEPEGKEEWAEMCQWHKLHWSVTEGCAVLYSTHSHTGRSPPV